MNVNNIFESKYIKNVDLQGQRITLTMERFALEEMRNDNKLVTYFVGKKKGMVLNKTKSMILANAFGAETDGWVGKSIIVYPTQVPYEGKLVDSIGIEISTPSSTPQTPAHNPPPAAQTPAQPASTADVPFDDDIPF